MCDHTTPNLNNMTDYYCMLLHVHTCRCSSTKIKLHIEMQINVNNFTLRSSLKIELSVGSIGTFDVLLKQTTLLKDTLTSS